MSWQLNNGAAVTPVREMCTMAEEEMNLTNIPDTIERGINFSNFVRRSARNPDVSHATRPDVWKLRQKLKNNDESTVVFKIKDHSIADLTPFVLDMIISDLEENTVCQALYVQNISEAMGEAQLTALTEVLKKKMIWCVNIGENYQISLEGWTRFCRALPDTNVTHLYVSEHTIPLALKNEMRDHIRANRKKHKLHNSEDNIPVIERCTNMWWNPMNHFKHKEEKRLLEVQRAKEEEERLVLQKKTQSEKRKASRAAAKEAKLQEKATNSAKKRKKVESYPDSVVSPEKWEFSCTCGLKCSHHDNARYHPKGEQFACDSCGVWSHVECVLKELPISEEEEVFCGRCRSVKMREMRNQCWLPLEFMPSASPAGGELLNHFAKEEDGSREREGSSAVTTADTSADTSAHQPAGKGVEDRVDRTPVADEVPIKTKSISNANFISFSYQQNVSDCVHKESAIPDGVSDDINFVEKFGAATPIQLLAPMSQSTSDFTSASDDVVPCETMTASSVLIATGGAVAIPQC